MYIFWFDNQFLIVISIESNPKLNFAKSIKTAGEKRLGISSRSLSLRYFNSYSTRIQPLISRFTENTLFSLIPGQERKQAQPKAKNQKKKQKENKKNDTSNNNEASKNKRPRDQFLNQE